MKFDTLRLSDVVRAKVRRAERRFWSDNFTSIHSTTHLADTCSPTGIAWRDSCLACIGALQSSHTMGTPTSSFFLAQRV